MKIDGYILLLPTADLSKREGQILMEWRIRCNTVFANGTFTNQSWYEMRTELLAGTIVDLYPRISQKARVKTTRRVWDAYFNAQQLARCEVEGYA